jgi:rRNA-processing protein FCF1
MKLGDITIHIPVFDILADVSYSYIPNLSPIEKALVAAINKFSGKSDIAFANIPIGDLFRELYGLSGADLFMPEVIDSLIDRGRIHRIGHLSGTSRELTIKDLGIGVGVSQTREMSAVNSKPDQSTQQLTVVKRLYDPISAEVLSSNGEVFVSLAGSYAIPAEPFHNQLEKSWIERELSNELEQEVKVSSIKLSIINTVWRTVPATLNVEGNQLSLKTSKESIQSYLSNLRPETRKQWFTSQEASFDKNNKLMLPEGSIYPFVIPENVDGLIIACGLLHEELNTLLIPKGTCLLNVVPRLDDSPTFTIEKCTDPERGLIINHAFDLHGIESAILWCDCGYNLISVKLNWQSTEITVRVAVPIFGYTEHEEIKNLIEVLQDEASVSQDPILSVLPGFWLDPQDFWSHVFTNFSSFVNVPEKLQFLELIVSGLQTLWNAGNANLEQSFPLESLKAQLEPTFLSLSESQLSHLIEILSNFQSWFTRDIDLLSLLPEPRTLEESSKLRVQFITNSIAFDYPSPVYGDHIINVLLAKFPIMDWLGSYPPQNDFEELLTALAKQFFQLENSSYDQTNSSVYAGSERTRSLESWWNLFSQLDAFYPVVSRALPDKFKVLNNEAKSLIVTASNLDIIAFDTNVLVNDRDLIDQLLPNDFLVFPRVVMREIDRLKTPRDKTNSNEVKTAEIFRVNSRSNLRSIHALPKESVVLPEGNYALLGPKEPRDNDGLIISCLLPYVTQSHSVTLVSEDIDLTLRCREYGINVINAKSYRISQQEKKRRMVL